MIVTIPVALRIALGLSIPIIRGGHKTPINLGILTVMEIPTGLIYLGDPISPLLFQILNEFMKTHRYASPYSLVALGFLSVLIQCSCKVESKTSCYANLKMIDGAKQQWAIDQGKTNGTTVSESDLLTLLRKMPSCPDGGSYEIGRIGEPPKCSLAEHKKYP